VAHDAESAIRAAEAFRPNVILLDLVLPDGRGQDVARRIRSQPWGKDDVMIVAMTGWSPRGDGEATEEHGFDFRVMKPLRYEMLTSILSPGANGASWT
jgi:CheY-like chemotaxis protein